MAFALIAWVAGTAQAAPMVFFGQDKFPDFVLTKSPAARASFLSNLVVGVGSEGLETQSAGNVGPLGLSFPGSSGSITATLTGDGTVVDTSGAGDFNTTPGGNNWWQTDHGDFTVSFSKPIAAFGFYATDVGDAASGGLVTLKLTDINNVVSTLMINSALGTDGTQLFYGFFDRLNTYKSIAFGNTSAGGDNFGFDDMVIGDFGQLKPVTPVLPLPGTLALVSLGLLGVALVRRRV
jgi:hypothetical protein